MEAGVAQTNSHFCRRMSASRLVTAQRSMQYQSSATMILASKNSCFSAGITNLFRSGPHPSPRQENDGDEHGRS
jgi:hypothetical protein